MSDECRMSEACVGGISQQLQERTRHFALRVIKMVQALPRSSVSEVIGKQVLRSATSVGANYRAACRARSKKEFIAKLGIVIEEADESIYWIQLVVDAGLMSPKQVSLLEKEAEEILSMIVASVKTAKGVRR